jgi:O-antigen/teichoic acid export membrane protein
VFTLTFGFILIPKIGIVGAGITASVSYMMTLLYQLIMFSRITNLSVKELMVRKADFDFLLTEIKGLIFKQNK